MRENVHEALTDERRIEAIRRSGLQPNMGDSGFDRHCRVAKAAVGAETVFFSVVDRDRQFFPSSIGLPDEYAAAGETPLTHSFCKYVVEDPSPLAIADAGIEPLVADSLAQRDLGIASYLGVPVRDEDGNVLGALCAAETTTRQWSDRDVGILTDISRSIESELRLRRSQQSLEHRLADERLAQEYEQALGQLARATSRSQTVQGVVDELAQRVSPSIGAALTSIAIVDHDELRFTHGSGVTPQVAEMWTSSPLDTTVPMAAAVVTGRVVHLADRSAFARYPVFDEVARSLELGSFRAIPFGDEATGLFGVLGVGWSQPMPEAEVPTALDRIVELATNTLARAWRFEVERDQARVLERVVLPTSLPSTKVYDVAGRYFAPDIGQRVGGDVYDVVVRSDGGVGVMVADAVGHDLTATRAVARLRHAIGVLMMEGYSPARIMKAVDTYVGASPSHRLVTCVCLLFAPDGRSVTVANAGHPQPVLRSGSAARSIGPVGESLLGRATSDYSETTVALRSGDVVVSFTDGLIDRRGRSILDGERWLRDFIERQPDGDAHAVASRLESELVDSGADDDMAFLVVSRPAATDHRTLRWTGRAGTLRLADRRRELAEWLVDQVDGAAIDTVLLVANELLTNAREASAPDDEITLTVGRADLAAPTGLPAIEVVVANRGPSFDVGSAMPAPESGRGRGLAIVEGVARTFDVGFEDGAVTVRAIVDLG